MLFDIWIVLGCVTLLPVIFAAPPPKSNKAATATIEPCAAVSQALKGGKEPLVPAQMGYECLMSVPVDVDGGIKQIEEMQLYLEWQTTTAYLKNPPVTSHQKPYDLYGELVKILDKLKAGSYKQEYVFQMDIYKTIAGCHEGHLTYAADIIYGVMLFMRDQEAILTSVSKDGVSLPDVYTLADIALASLDNSFKPSPVTKINGKVVEDYLENLTNFLTPNDIEARYNGILYSQAAASTGDMGSSGYGFFFEGFYDGPTTCFTFDNGTTREFQNYAAVATNFTGVDSGQTFFNKFCTGPSTTASSTPSSSSTSALPPPTVVGYPYPVFKSDANTVSGYYLNDTGYQDVAVLSIPTFLMPGFTSVVTPGITSVGQQEFQTLIRRFLADCGKTGKKKLIIDLRGNPGGDGILAVDTFKQLFPNQDPYVGMNIRASEAYHEMGQQTAKNVEQGELKVKNHTEYSLDRLLLLMEDYTTSVDINNQNWNSFEELYGPLTIHGDNFTKVVRENYSDPDSYGYWGFSVTGYLNNTQLPKQPFAAENIFMIQDGACGSTCALFSEMMTTQGKVRSIVTGGRPNDYPMAGVAGTKGAINLGWQDINTDANALYNLAPQEEQAHLNGTAIGKIISSTHSLKRAAQIAEGVAAKLNGRNLIRKGDDTMTPLQFIWEAANKKIFNTAEMILDPTAVWRAAYDCMYEKKGCVSTVTPKTWN